MPIRSTLFDSLRLSKQPEFRAGDAETLAKRARHWRDIIEDPEIKAALRSQGIPPSFLASTLDVPTTAEGFLKTRARDIGERRGVSGVGNAVSEGAAQMANFFGVDDVILSLIGAPGADIDPSAFSPIPGTPGNVDIPFLGESNVATLGTQLASFLVPAGLAVRGAGAAVAATGLTASAPGAASALTFALGGSTLEAGRQAIRTQTKDEEFDPTQIAIEGAIFGAGGAALPGGALARRLGAGVLSGTAATVIPPLLGKEVDPSRVASEVAFALAFGNPKLGDLVAGDPTPRIPKLEKVDKAKAAELKLQRERDLVAKDIQKTREAMRTSKTRSAAEVKKLGLLKRRADALNKNKAAEELRTVADEMTSETLQDPTVTTVHDPIRTIDALRAKGKTPKEMSDALKLQAEAIENLVSNDVEVLKTLMETPGLSESQKMLIRDALAEKAGRTTTTIDAPSEATRLPEKDMSVQLHPKSDEMIGELAKRQVADPIFQAGKGDPQVAADSIVFKALERGDTGLKPKDAKQLMKTMSQEQRLDLALNMERARDVVRSERLQAGKKAFTEEQLDVEASNRLNIEIGTNGEFNFIPLREVPGTRPGKRQEIIDIARIRENLMGDLRAEESRLVKKTKIAKVEGDEAVSARLEQEIAVVTEKQTAMADSNSIPEVANFGQARMVVDEMVDDMTVKQMTAFMDDLPSELEAFRGQLDVELRRKVKHRTEAAKTRNDTETILRNMNDADDVGVTISVRGGQQGLGKSAPKTSKGISFNDVRSEWHKHGGDLAPTARGFDLVHQGQTHNFGSLKAAQEALDDIDNLVAHEPSAGPTKTVDQLSQEIDLQQKAVIRGSRANKRQLLDDLEELRAQRKDLVSSQPKKQNLIKPVLDVAATRKLVTIEHVGNGSYRTVNKTTGEQVIHDSMKSVSDQISNTAAPPSVEIMPIGDGTVSSGGGGGIGGPGSSGKKPNFEMPEPQAGTFPGGFGRALGTRGDIMKRIQDNIGLPVWDDVWEPMMRAQNLRDHFQSASNRELKVALKGVVPGRMRVVQDILISGDASSKVIRDLGATKKEVAAATRLVKWYGDTMGLGRKELNEFFSVDIPAFRMQGGDPMRVRAADNTFPGSIREILDDVIEGRLDLAEPNAHVMAQDVLYALGRQRFMLPATKQARNLQRQLTKRELTKGIEEVERQKIITTKQIVGEYMDSVLNGAGGTGRGQSTSEALKPFFNKLRKMGLIKRRPPTAKEIDQWSAEYASYISGAALSARPALAFRNFQQRLLAGNKVGFDTVLDAQRMALTPEGLKLIQDSGVIPGRITWFMEDVAALIKDDAAARQMVQRAQSAGLWLYRKADHGNRGVSFLSGYLSVKEHSHLLKRGDIDEFLVQTGMATESTTVLNRVLKDLSNVEARGWDAAVEKAAREYGVRLAEDTQFIYNPANAPQWMQGLVGRFAGQFGVWPIAFTEYTRRNMGPITAGGARGRAANLFMVRQTAQMAALSAVGATLGIDMSSYNRANPLAFEGGPVKDALSDVTTIAFGTEGEFGTRLAMRNLERFVTTFWIPFGGAVQDVRQAMDKKDPVEAMLTLLGFTTQEPGLF